VKRLLSILIMMGCLLAAAPSPGYAQGDPATSTWHVALYDIATREVIIVRPDSVETLTTPACFEVSTDPADYLSRYNHAAMISPDLRFIAAGTPETFPGVIVADLANETCVEVRIDDEFAGFNTEGIPFVLDTGVFNPAGTQLAFAWGPPGSIVLIDLAEAPGTILQSHDYVWPNPLNMKLEYWDDEGIYFYGTCYDCGASNSGRLRVWDPATDLVTDTEKDLTRYIGDRLPLTEEIIVENKDLDYPHTGYEFELNVVEYVAEEPETIRQVVYHSPDLQDWPRPRWVLDGNGVFVRHTVVLRDGQIIPVEAAACQTIVAGTPDGWLAQGEQSLTACQLEDGEVAATPVDVTLNGPIVLIGQSPLGAAASDSFIPLSPADAAAD
jgi:hypothetical protein